MQVLMSPNETQDFTFFDNEVPRRLAERDHSRETATHDELGCGEPVKPGWNFLRSAFVY
jgi:hypothetical protein